MPYYGLYIPIKSGGGGSSNSSSGGGSGSSAPPASGNSANSSSGGGSDSSEPIYDSPYVFYEKSEALEVLKMHKDARLREFSCEDDAFKYAHTGYEVVQTKYTDVKTSTAAVEKAPFRAPTKQELIEFRKIIEAGDYERIKSIIWDNPRYLVSSGDTPTTLKEGYRYNAMHVCAISKKPRIAELILQTVSNTKFVDLLTGKKNDEKMCKELCVNLLDYYLNIPEKGRSETPLHFAAKNGSIEMVEVLTSYPECKMTTNSEGLLPKEIICHRVAQAPPELCKRIEALLEERFYVPVIRSVDNAIPPHIGQPFSANNPPNLNCDLLSPEVKIQALAGPMKKEQAKQFCRRWKTPPRMGSSNASSPIINSPFISPMKSRMNINSTPTKSTYAMNNSCDSPTISLHRRTLFNSTPQRSPAQSHVLKEQNLSTNVEDNGDDTSYVDEQNGNHKNKEDKAVVTEIVITAEASESITLEANNNQEQQAEGQEPSSTEHLSTLHNPMYPNTPMLHMKKEIFFTYREQNVPSPVVFDALSDGYGSSNNSINSLKFEYDSPDAVERESCLKKNATRRMENKQSIPPMRPSQMSMLKTALCPKTPLFKMKKEFNFQYNENYITWDMRCDSPGFKERHIKITDTEKGLEVIGRELAKEQKIEWREYWDFLNQFIDIASPHGLDKLENYFAQRIKDEEMSKKTAQAMANSAVILDNVCNVLEKFSFVKNSAASTGGGGGVGSSGGGSKDGRNGFSIERSRFDNYYPSSSSVSSTATATVAAAPQTTNPYTCVEKSLQVFAKRMTKTIIHNIDNVVSINDTLLSELKRLKSLICSFKEDARFLNVNFTKVHSRIGNLISIYLENSQEVTEAVKLKIQNIIQNLLLTPGERREHIDCVSTRILLMLERSTEQILPENLKTEDMCSKVWLQERECECQWETNLSRKTSRRNRMEARYKSHQQAKQQEKSKTDLISLASSNFDYLRNFPSTGANDSSDDMDEDIYWSDFGGSDSDDEDEVWATPPESPSRISLMESAEDDGYGIYVYGNEPTKRDLDILNAIFHIDIDKHKHPNIHSWKSALLRYPNEEMDYFPSPSIVKKSHSFIMRNSGTKKGLPQTPITQKNHQYSSMKPSTPSTPSSSTTPEQSLTQNKQHHQLPNAKRLFMSPSSKSIPAIPPSKPTPSLTPLNKIRGLFSAYRADRSPMSSASPAAAAFSSDHSGSEGSNNLSLLNVSASE